MVALGDGLRTLNQPYGVSHQVKTGKATYKASGNSRLFSWQLENHSHTGDSFLLLVHLTMRVFVPAFSGIPLEDWFVAIYRRECHNFPLDHCQLQKPELRRNTQKQRGGQGSYSVRKGAHKGPGERSRHTRCCSDNSHVESIQDVNHKLKAVHKTTLLKEDRSD